MYHPGEDWNGNGGGDTDLGDEVDAAADGKVIAVGEYGTGWGNIVLLEHTLGNGNKIWTQYAHLDEISVASGSDVYRGDQVGTIGKGHDDEYDAHLHFEVRYQYRSPSAWVSGWSQQDVLDYYKDPSNYINSFRAPINVTGTINSNTTWKTYHNYTIDGSVTLAASASLTVQPGAIVKLKSASSLTVNGDMYVNGTSASKSYFTSFKDDTIGGDTNGDGSSSTPSAGDWKDIEVGSGGIASISHSIIRFGSYYTGGFGSASNIISNGTLRLSNSTIASSSYYGIRVASGSANITNSTIKDITNTGVYAYGNGSLTLGNNAFIDNGAYPVELTPGGGMAINAYGNSSSGTGKHGYYVSSTTMSASQTWGNDLPYIIYSSGMTVGSGKTLTLDPGAIIKFDADANLTIDGQLFAIGTPSNRIYFTSLLDDSVGGDTNNAGGTPGVGNWEHLRFNSGSTASISYATIRFGGRPWYYGSYSDLYITGGLVDISYSTIASSYWYGVYMSGGTASISHSNIYDNSYGIFNGTTATVSAENNWWGASSGPTHSSNPGGTGNEVSNYVDFSPFATLSWPY